MKLIKVAASDAAKAYKEHRESAESTGLTPLVLADYRFAETILKRLQDSPASGQKCLAKALKMDGGTFLKKRREKEEKALKKMKESIEEMEESLLGKWPKKPRQSPQLSYLIDRSKEVGILLLEIPPADSWQIPALIEFGGWDLVPLPEEQAAVHRRWAEAYGSEVFAISYSTIMCRVARPPMTKEDAIALAWEHYRYCDDRVLQGSDDISTLAAELLNAPEWYFWFD